MKHYKYIVYAILDPAEGHPHWLESPEDWVALFENIDNGEHLFSAASLEELRLKALASSISDADVQPEVMLFRLSDLWYPSDIRYR